MSKIFLPLRSNAAWFLAHDTRNALERQIKNYMLFYDEVIIQNARYICIIGDTGAFDLMISPDAYPRDRTKIQYFTPGKPFGVHFKGTPLFGGTARVSYEADFYPILYDAGLLSEAYFKWESIDLPDKLKNIVSKEAKKDLSNKSLSNILPNNYFQQEYTLKSLYIDSVLAFKFDLPFMVDSRMAPVIQWKNNQVRQSWKPELKGIFFNIWINFGLPDFSNISWDEVHSIRESKAGQDLRRMIEKITIRVSESIDEIKNEEDISHLIQKEFINEIVDELCSRSTTPMSVLFNIGLNFIPYGGVIGATDDIRNLFRERKSWVSLLKRK